MRGPASAAVERGASAGAGGPAGPCAPFGALGLLGLFGRFGLFGRSDATAANDEFEFARDALPFGAGKLVAHPNPRACVWIGVAAASFLMLL
jgi:hypothetical protein